MPKVEKHALALGEPPRVRSEQHRHWIAELPCVACYMGNYPHGSSMDLWTGVISQAAHLRTGQRGGIGLKPPDSDIVPLCPKHHAEQHAWKYGEADWWFQQAVLLAGKLAGMSPDEKVKNAAT